MQAPAKALARVACALALLATLAAATKSSGSERVHSTRSNSGVSPSRVPKTSASAALAAHEETLTAYAASTWPSTLRKYRASGSRLPSDPDSLASLGSGNARSANLSSKSAGTDITTLRHRLAPASPEEILKNTKTDEAPFDRQRMDVRFVAGAQKPELRRKLVALTDSLGRADDVVEVCGKYIDLLAGHMNYKIEPAEPTALIQAKALIDGALREFSKNIPQNSLPARIEYNLRKCMEIKHLPGQQPPLPALSEDHYSTATETQDEQVVGDFYKSPGGEASDSALESPHESLEEHAENPPEELADEPLDTLETEPLELEPASGLDSAAEASELLASHDEGLGKSLDELAEPSGALPDGDAFDCQSQLDELLALEDSLASSLFKYFEFQSGTKPDFSQADEFEVGDTCASKIRVAKARIEKYNKMVNWMLEHWTGPSWACPRSK